MSDTIELTEDQRDALQPVVNAILDENTGNAQQEMSKALSDDLFSGSPTSLIRQAILFNQALQGIVRAGSIFTEDSENTTPAQRQQKEERKQALRSVLRLIEEHNIEQTRQRIEDMLDDLGELKERIANSEYLTSEQKEELTDIADRLETELTEALERLETRDSNIKDYDDQISNATSKVDSTIPEVEGYGGTPSQLLNSLLERGKKIITVKLTIGDIGEAPARRYVVYNETGNENDSFVYIENENGAQERYYLKNHSNIAELEKAESHIKTQRDNGERYGNELNERDPAIVENFEREYKIWIDLGERHPELMAIRHQVSRLVDLKQTEEGKRQDVLIDLKRIEEKKEALEQALQNMEMGRADYEQEMQKLLTRQQEIMSDYQEYTDQADAAGEKIKQKIKETIAELEERLKETEEELEEIEKAAEDLSEEVLETERHELLDKHFGSKRLRIAKSLVEMIDGENASAVMRQHALNFMNAGRNRNHKLTKAWENYMRTDIDGVERPLAADANGRLYWVELGETNEYGVPKELAYHPIEGELTTEQIIALRTEANDPETPRFWYSEIPKSQFFETTITEENILTVGKQIALDTNIRKTEKTLIEEQIAELEQCKTSDDEASCIADFEAVVTAEDAMEDLGIPLKFEEAFSTNATEITGAPTHPQAQTGGPTPTTHPSGTGAQNQ